MKVFGETLLISCYELGHQPMGLALTMAFFEQAGFKPDTIDLSLEPLETEKVRVARFIAISVPMHTALRIGMDAALRIRKMNAKAHISFFGLYASLNRELLLKGVADSVIGGEYESPLLALLESITLGEEKEIEGVSTRRYFSEPLLKHLPFVIPSREALLPLEKYAQLLEGAEARTAGYVEASRGCRHFCRHCPIPPVYQGRFFLLPKDNVLQDIKNQVEAGATHITFGDPDFLNGAVHSLRVARGLHEAFPEITFDFTAKVEHLIQHQSSLPELKSLGCIFIISAVESFSENILPYLVKGHTRQEAIEVFHLTTKAGIALRPTFVPFTPWTTLEDMLDLFVIIEKEGMIQYVDPIQFSIRLLIPPGSLLLSEHDMMPFLGELDPMGISYRWDHPDARVDDLQKRFSQLIEDASESLQNTEMLFYQLKEYVYAAIEGREPREIEVRSLTNAFQPPRLSESWFCCSEPTEKQLCLGSDKLDSSA